MLLRLFGRVCHWFVVHWVIRFCKGELLKVNCIVVIVGVYDMIGVQCLSERYHKSW